MKAILSGNAQIAKAVNATLISLDQASKGYKQFDSETSKSLLMIRI
ncbi:threonine dehydrogenase-like Zn-dependent dehydrogenase [Virgibacillus litoralis]|uniref:Threonine dehydrogenase-like Zn-dependent dehydrogenase n=1 Tax=Virgibacillus litoralis TaxID=578221 RepID=A0ABS4HAL7_9BACI|nr:threonine dehydrogenase-like Zn-dependent dehydrogenase [Virgibacillus litoralis]